MTKKTDKPGHGGARPGAGAKSKDGAKLETTFLFDLSNEQKAKVKRLGGGPWLRGKIDAAKEPGPK